MATVESAPPPPAWLDRARYPFTRRIVALPAVRMHFVDEGHGEPVGSSAWYAALWKRRDRLLGRLTLIVRGMRDPAFTPAHLARWESLFGPTARVVRLAAAGHWPHEEAPEVVAREIRALLHVAVRG
jgi:pimeloyl-ACP methyl ester carboxylesterase